MKSLLPFSLAALLLLGSARAAEPAGDTIIGCAGLFETISTATEITSTFRNKVVVTGINLKLTCDFLTVIALPKGAKTAALGDYWYLRGHWAEGRRWVFVYRELRRYSLLQLWIFVPLSLIALTGYELLTGRKQPPDA